MAKHRTLKALFEAIADAIRAKTGGTDQIVADDFPDAIDSIEQGGGLDMFSYITTVGYFSTDVKDITENIVLHLDRVTNMSNLFDLRELNAPKITVYIGNACTSMYRSFGRVDGTVKVIEVVGNTSKVTTFAQCFQSRTKLEEVICEFDFSSATTTSNVFANCAALRKFTVVPNTLSLSLSVKESPDLTDDTIQSLVDGYKDMTGQTSPVLTLHANVKERMTDEQKAALTSKNITLA